MRNKQLGNEKLSTINSDLSRQFIIVAVDWRVKRMRRIYHETDRLAETLWYFAKAMNKRIDHKGANVVV
jgi:hypothetical protein